MSQYKTMFECKDKLILVTEYLKGIDLMSVIRSNETMPMKDVKVILTGIAKGLKECHQRNIIHRDIKP